VKLCIYFAAACYAFLLSVPAQAQMNDSSLLSKAEAGDVCAQSQVAYNYNHATEGAKKDREAALEWYMKAAKGTCTDYKCEMCQLDVYRSLAIYYENNDENKKAFEWYKKAALGGYQLAYPSLARYYAEGKVTAQDYEEAYYWLRLGINRNTKSSYDDFIKTVESQLSPAQIAEQDARIAAAIEKWKKKLEKQQKKNSKKAASAFQSAEIEDGGANARLAFELRNKYAPYDMHGIQKLLAAGALQGEIPASRFLFMAQEKGEAELVRAFIDAGADINATDERGFTVLQRSIGYNNSHITLMLIEEGAEIESTSDLGQTPLISAAIKGNSKVVKALIDAGARIDVKSKGYFALDALGWARKQKNYNVVKLLLEHGANSQEGDALMREMMSACDESPELCEERVEETKPETAQNDTPPRTDISSRAIRALSSSDPIEREATIGAIKQSPGSYSPLALLSLSSRLFMRIEDDEAAFWYLAAYKRYDEDVDTCRKTYPQMRIDGFARKHVAHYRPYVSANPSLLVELNKRAEEWNRVTPREYTLDCSVYEKKPIKRFVPAPKTPPKISVINGVEHYEGVIYSGKEGMAFKNFIARNAGKTISLDLSFSGAVNISKEGFGIYGACEKPETCGRIDDYYFFKGVDDLRESKKLTGEWEVHETTNRPDNEDSRGDNSTELRKPR
jgi:hypothetical protein